MHSYAFYNGHLSETERRLRELDSPSTASKAPAYQYPSSAGHARSPSGNTDLTKSHADEVAQLREDLALELTSPMGSVTYPRNLTWFNYVDYIFCPTLCYELEYPRTPGIVWTELGYKILATFGVIFLLTITSEEFILPVMVESAQRLESVTSFPETALILAESISMLLFPFMITFLLVFLVIFEYVLGAFAEITCMFFVFQSVVFVSIQPPASSLSSPPSLLPSTSIQIFGFTLIVSHRFCRPPFLF
jgi:sterol O-acyltransferase